jgi:hypothetical protein
MCFGGIMALLVGDVATGCCGNLLLWQLVAVLAALPISTITLSGLPFGINGTCTHFQWVPSMIHSDHFA